MRSPRPVFLGRRQLHPTASISTTVNARAGSGGLAVRYDEQTVYSLTVRDDGKLATITAEARVPSIVQTWKAVLPSGPVELTLAAAPPADDDIIACRTSDYVSLSARSGRR